MKRLRILVKGFTVERDTVSAMTTITPGSLDASGLPQDICRGLGGFVWARANRHFGIQNIKVVGLKGELLLSSHFGLKGQIQ